MHCRTSLPRFSSDRSLVFQSVRRVTSFVYATLWQLRYQRPSGPHSTLSGPYRRRATPLWLTTVRVAGQEVKKQRGSKINLLSLQAIISIQAGLKRHKVGAGDRLDKDTCLIHPSSVHPSLPPSLPPLKFPLQFCRCYDQLSGWRETASQLWVRSEGRSNGCLHVCQVAGCGVMWPLPHPIHRNCHRKVGPLVPCCILVSSPPIQDDQSLITNNESTSWKGMYWELTPWEFVSYTEIIWWWTFFFPSHPYIGSNAVLPDIIHALM